MRAKWDHSRPAAMIDLHWLLAGVKPSAEPELALRMERVMHAVADMGDHIPRGDGRCTVSCSACRVKRQVTELLYGEEAKR